MEKVLRLTYDSLIALLQGKEIHLKDLENHIIIVPPFDGVFLTHKEVDEIKYNSQMKIFNIIQEIAETKEEIK